MARPSRRTSSILPFTGSTKMLFIASVMFFFWALYDGTISYISPLLITEHGYSDATMGFLISLSSVAGGFFDVVIGRYLKDPHWKRVFFAMFVASALTAFMLWRSSTIPLFILAMALWGLYFNLSNFGMYDFVSVNAPADDRGREYGVLNIFRFLGYIVTPIVLGFLIIDTVTDATFIYLAIGLAISFIFFLFMSRAAKILTPERTTIRKVSVHKALHSVYRDGFKLLPVMSVIILYNILEAFFWIIGPLLSVQFQNLHPWDGLFVTAYFLPILLTGWFVERVVKRFGKKRSAMFSLLFGSVLLLPFFFVSDPYVMIALIFFASLFISFSLPCINAAFADYISDDRRDEAHIEAMSDFSANAGYVIGPILAGISAGIFGNIMSFGILGVGTLACSLLLIRYTPRHINLVRRTRP